MSTKKHQKTSVLTLYIELYIYTTYRGYILYINISIRDLYTLFLYDLVQSPQYRALKVYKHPFLLLFACTAFYFNDTFIIKWLQLTKIKGSQMELQKIRKQLQELIDSKTINRMDVARGANLGYFTIRNILDENYEFEVKQNTLRKVKEYLDALA